MFSSSPLTPCHGSWPYFQLQDPRVDARRVDERRDMKVEITSAASRGVHAQSQRDAVTCPFVQRASLEKTPSFLSRCSGALRPTDHIVFALLGRGGLPSDLDGNR